jgi:hypothetical protein
MELRLLCFFFSLADQAEGPVEHIEEEAHEQGHAPTPGVFERVEEAVAYVIEQANRFGYDVPTVPSEVPADIDAECADKQKHR